MPPAGLRYCYFITTFSSSPSSCYSWYATQHQQQRIRRCSCLLSCLVKASLSYSNQAASRSQCLSQRRRSTVRKSFSIAPRLWSTAATHWGANSLFYNDEEAEEEVVCNSKKNGVVAAAASSSHNSNDESTTALPAVAGWLLNKWQENNSQQHDNNNNNNNDHYMMFVNDIITFFNNDNISYEYLSKVQLRNVLEEQSNQQQQQQQ